MSSPNLDPATVSGFGREWSWFNHTGFSLSESRGIFARYFAIVPWEKIDLPNAEIADFGCGTGRWAAHLALQVAKLHAVDASHEALAVARENLKDHGNVRFHAASLEQAGIADSSLDFAFSLGVLHHLPDTPRAIADIARKLKPGAPFLVYLYYAFDNRPTWYRCLWKMTDFVRRVLSRSPFAFRWLASQMIAVAVYWPLAKTAAVLENLRLLPEAFPLAFYRGKSFYVMRTDALDRFGTRLEQRFTKRQIEIMLRDAGFRDIVFSNHAPYWCAVGIRS
jgi:ubiquinone/menaquinone biosynthesis C-methylase UbiE